MTQAAETQPQATYTLQTYLPPLKFVCEFPPGKLQPPVWMQAYLPIMEALVRMHGAFNMYQKFLIRWQDFLVRVRGDDGRPLLDPFMHQVDFPNDSRH
jgi:hypothetical protein